MGVLDKKDLVAERVNEVLLKEIRAIVVDALTCAAADISIMGATLRPGSEKAIIDMCEARVLRHAGKTPPVRNGGAPACYNCCHWSGGDVGNDHIGYCLIDDGAEPRVFGWGHCSRWT